MTTLMIRSDMRFVVNSRAATYELGGVSEADLAGRLLFPHAIAAEQFLRRSGGLARAARLRQLAVRHALTSDVSRLDDAAVIKLVAQALAQGRIWVLSRSIRTTSASPAAPAPEAPAPSPRPQSASSSSTAPTEPSTFPPDFDAAAQADALISAAESGAPFCEECARRRAARTAA